MLSNRSRWEFVREVLEYHKRRHLSSVQCTYNFPSASIPYYLKFTRHEIKANFTNSR